MKQLREQRLSGEFRKNIYEIIQNKVKNPDISELFSVSDVEVTNDLKHAKVYVSVFAGSEESKKRTFDAIAASAGFIRKELGVMMHIRTVPELHFMTDKSQDYGEKIDKLLEGLTYGENEDDDNGNS